MSFKVIDFCTNRERVWDFLLVRHSNFGPILHHFRDRPIADFCTHDPTPIPPYFWRGMFPLDKIADVGVNLRLIRCEIFSKYSNLCDHGT